MSALAAILCKFLAVECLRVQMLQFAHFAVPSVYLIHNTWNPYCFRRSWPMKLVWLQVAKYGFLCIEHHQSLCTDVTPWRSLLHSSMLQGPHITNSHLRLLYPRISLWRRRALQHVAGGHTLPVIVYRCNNVEKFSLLACRRGRTKGVHTSSWCI